MKTKKLIKKALQSPQMYSKEELLYFQLWLKAKKEKKRKSRINNIMSLEKSLLL